MNSGGGGNHEHRAILVEASGTNLGYSGFLMGGRAGGSCGGQET